MENIETNKNTIKTIICIALCIVVMAVSFFAIAPKMEKIETYKVITQSLDDKRASVIEMSGALVGLSIAVAAVPGDATTPIATQVAQLNSYLVMSLGAIMLEKFLLPIMGMIAWRILIPAAGLLMSLYFSLKKKALLGVALRVAIFGIACFLLIPAGVKVGDLVDESFGTKTLVARIETDIAEINKEAEETKEDETEQESGGSFWEKFVDDGRELIDNVTNNGAQILEKAKAIIGDIMDAVAALVITSCAIPIGILIVLIAVIKALFSALTRFIPVSRDDS